MSAARDLGGLKGKSPPRVGATRTATLARESFDWVVAPQRAGTLRSCCWIGENRFGVKKEVGMAGGEDGVGKERLVPATL